MTEKEELCHDCTYWGLSVGGKAKGLLIHVKGTPNQKAANHCTLEHCFGEHFSVTVT